MEIITAAINAMYDLDLTRAEVINIGKHILKTELAFNDKAGITKVNNDVPEFLKLEPSKPSSLKFTFTKEELQNFWKKLE